MRARLCRRRLLLASLLLGSLIGPWAAAARDDQRCGSDRILASGRPDPALFSAEASAGVRAFWCERYDDLGRSTRDGPYWERDATGRLRSESQYVAGRLEGPLVVHHEDGGIGLRATLVDGRLEGPYELFHPNGVRWIEAHFDAGRLSGTVRSWYPDGALESEARYEAGAVRGLARSFHPSARGGRLRSELRYGASGEIAGHRLLDPRGRPVTRRRAGGPIPASTPGADGSGRTQIRRADPSGSPPAPAAPAPAFRESPNRD